MLSSFQPQPSQALPVPPRQPQASNFPGSQYLAVCPSWFALPASPYLYQSQNARERTARGPVPCALPSDTVAISYARRPVLGELVPGDRWLKLRERESFARRRAWARDPRLRTSGLARGRRRRASAQHQHAFESVSRPSPIPCRVRYKRVPSCLELQPAHSSSTCYRRVDALQTRMSNIHHQGFHHVTSDAPRPSSSTSRRGRSRATGRRGHHRKPWRRTNATQRS